VIERFASDIESLQYAVWDENNNIITDKKKILQVKRMISERIKITGIEITPIVSMFAAAKRYFMKIANACGNPATVFASSELRPAALRPTISGGLLSS
jgi:hypothetical protein